MYAYLFNDYTSALKFLNSYRPLSGYISKLGGFIDPTAIFYDGLISFEAATSSKEEPHIKQGKLNMSKLRNLSKNAPMNFSNKVYFLEAEMAVVHGNVPKAIENYNAAINLSKKYDILIDEALACERAGMFFLSLNSSIPASEFLLKAYRCYDDWGAKAKLHQLATRYPVIFVQNPIDFTGMRLAKESEASIISAMSDPIAKESKAPLSAMPYTSSFTNDDESFKHKRKRS